MANANSRLQAHWASPPTIAWARKQVGLSLPDAARITGFSLDTMKAWEEAALGEQPSLSQLERLAEVYDCPVGYFFLSEPPSEQMRPLSFRGLSHEKVESLSYQSRIQLRRFTQLMSYAEDWIRWMSDVRQPNVGEASPDDPIEEVVVG